MRVDERLLREYRKTDWSLDELARRAGWKCSRSSTYKKITGDQVVSIEEYEGACKALGFVLEWSGGSRFRPRRAA